MLKVKLSVVFLMIFCFNSFTQTYVKDNHGVGVSVTSSFGSHFQRFGVSVYGYMIFDFIQINSSIKLYNNFLNLGPKNEYLELNAALGLCLGYGQQLEQKNLFINSVSNQTKYQNSISYSYNFWVNKVKTSQVTGIIALQFNHFSIITENDALAKRFLDRFRTGALLLQYQNKNFQYSINGTMWTGKLGKGVRDDVLFPKPGYLNTDNGLYCDLSHGLLSGQVMYVDEYGQNYQANIGVDAEQVRNVLQNKLIHDLPFVPEKWNTAQNLHFPMIDVENNQYLYRPEQKIRKTKLFLNGFINPNIFY